MTIVEFGKGRWGLGLGKRSKKASMLTIKLCFFYEIN